MTGKKSLIWTEVKGVAVLGHMGEFSFAHAVSRACKWQCPGESRS